MSAKDWADDAIGHIKRVGDSASRISGRSQAPRASNSPAPSAAVTPKMIADALAEMLKNDNSTTQAIAVRISNLAAKYPNKAY